MLSVAGLFEGFKQQDPSCLKPHPLSAVLIQNDLGSRDRERFISEMLLYQCLPLTVRQSNKNAVVSSFVTHEWGAILINFI